jgi:hypothetical protein
LAEGNWESKNSIRDLIDHFKTIDGADIEGLDNLSNNIIQLTEAVSENTSAQLRGKGYKIQDLIKEIASGEINPNSLTDEQKKDIESVSGLNGEFIQIGTGKWQYKGNLYEDLSK